MFSPTWYSVTLFVSFIIVNTAYSKDAAIRLDVTCKGNDQCGENQYCSKVGICECNPEAFLLGKHCIVQEKLGKSCFSSFQCPEYAHCSNNVCGCKPNTLQENSICKPTANYQAPSGTVSNIRRTERVTGNDKGTVAITVTVVIIMLVLTSASAYEILRIKKYVAKSQNQYNKVGNDGDECHAEDDANKGSLLEPPPEYHTVVQQAINKGNDLDGQ